MIQSADRRTLIGVAVFVLLSLGAMAIIGRTALFAAQENAAALMYERAGAQLQVTLRGLDETALTDGSLASLETVRRGMRQFKAIQRGSAELRAATADGWPQIEHQINELIKERRNLAFDVQALILLGRVTESMGNMASSLELHAQEKRIDAQAAELRIQIVNVVTGALLLISTAGFFFVRDITAKKVLGVVRASEVQLRQITDAVPALISYVDAGRRFRFHNKAYEESLGLRSEQMHGRTLLEVFGEEAYEKLRPYVDQVLAGQPVHFEHTRADAPGGARDYLSHFFPRHRGDQPDWPVIGFYSLVTDITDMKRVDRMKSEFISIVSHELRTPLTSIRGSLGLIAGGMAGVLPDAAKKLVDIAKNNCERLVRLINNILDTEKIESGKMRFDLNVIDLEPLIGRTIADNEGFAAEHGVRLALTACAEALRVNVDSDGLRQVITNLLSNAVKFSPRGETVQVALRRANSQVRVEVRDRGPGIPDEFRSRIFQKFSQADSSDSRQKGGSGLGLNISQAIIERLGGTIGFTTEAGVGTTFYFELPAWRDPSASTFSAAPRQTKRPCVLVCEDDPDIARLVGMMLDRAGYDTDLAASAAKAQQLAAAGSYAAMTLDLRLPDRNGIALMRMLRDDERTRRTPIVILSAFAADGRIRLNSEMLSVKDWLSRPIDSNHLVVAIRDAAAGRTRNRPRILYIEAEPDIQHVSAAVSRDFATFEFAANLTEARARMRLWKYDLVLLDLDLPEGEGSGWQLLPEIHLLSPPPPVIALSSGELTGEERARVAAVLVKAHTSDQEFIEVVQHVLERRRAHSGKPEGGPVAQAA